MVKKPKRFKHFIFIFIFTIYSSIFLASIINSLPNNSISNYINEDVFHNIYPQGWGFFSKDPKDDNIFIKNEKGVDVTNFPLNTLANSLGLSREGRVHGVEYGIFSLQIDEGSWIKCDEGINSCLKNDNSKEIKITNNTANPTICGTHYLVTEEIVPRLWVKYKENMNNPSSYVKVGIKCTEI